jgi:hypothetical protein
MTTTATLMTDAWEGVHANNQSLSGATWTEVEDALRALDGRKHTQVVVRLEDGSSAIVGGGDGRYNVCLETADDRYLTLRNDDAPEDAVEELIAGGQKGDYPARIVVGLEPAVQAVRTFYESGEADAGLDWDEE